MVIKIDIQILDSMLAQYERVFTGGINSVHGYAIGTLWLLVGIDFALSVLLNLENADHIKNLISKIFKYGFWVWIVDNYGAIVDAILDSLTTVGFSVGGGLSADILKHPSMICEQGILISQPFINFLSEQNTIDLVFGKLGVNIMTLFCIIIIWIAFAILAIQVCITYIEFYLSATLLFIFIPFGANKHLSFLAEKSIGAVFAFGVKLMILGAVLGVSGPIVNSWAVEITGTPTYSVMFAAATASCLLAFLAWQAPALAAGMMSGAPSLSAGTVAGMGVAGAAAAIGGTMAATGAAKAAASFGGGAARTGASLAGAAIAGGQNVNSTTAPITGAMKGVASYASSGIQSSLAGMKEAMKGAYAHGASSATGNNSSSASSAAQSQGGASQSTTAQTRSSSMGNMAMAGQAVQRAVPPEGAPQGGMSAPIRNDD